MPIPKQPIDFERIEMSKRVIARVAAGELLTDATNAEGVPTWTFMLVLKRFPDLDEEFRAAKQANAFYQADESVRVTTDQSVDPKRARFQSLARQWLASKLDRATFGERLDLQTSGSIDLVHALSAADQRLRLDARTVPSAVAAQTAAIGGEKPVLEAQVVDLVEATEGRASDHASVADDAPSDPPAPALRW